MNGDGKTRQVPWQPLVAELVGTALLVLVGLTVVILMFGATLPGGGYTAAEVLMGGAIMTFLLMSLRNLPGSAPKQSVTWRAVW